MSCCVHLLSLSGAFDHGDEIVTRGDQAPIDDSVIDDEVCLRCRAVLERCARRASGVEQHSCRGWHSEFSYLVRLAQDDEKRDSIDCSAFAPRLATTGSQAAQPARRKR